MDFYTQSESQNGPVELQTTNKADFRPFTTAGSPRSIFAKANNQFFVPNNFTNKSTYKLNYVDWQFYDSKNVKPKPVTTVVPNQKFLGTTQY